MPRYGAGDIAVNSLLLPKTKKDYVIKCNHIKELLHTHELGTDFLEALNARVVTLALEAADRCSANKRRRARGWDV